MEFEQCLEEIIKKVSFDQELTDQVKLASEAILDNPSVEVDDNGRLIMSKKGFKLNSIEEVINTTEKLSYEEKIFIINLIEECRLFLGAKMIESYYGR